jgi:septal ring factor EnvC (AmiA/AmiB activator)
MPRGRKPLNVRTIEEQIAEADASIETYKQKIAEAKELKKQLQEQKKKKEMPPFYRAVKQSEKTAAEFLETIQKNG